MGTREYTANDHPDHTMPSRRERLRAFMRLKSQRRILAGSLAGLGAVTLTLGAAFAHESDTPDVVTLGTGKASVEAKPLAAYEPAQTATPAPTPSVSESPVGDGEASYYGNELAGNRTASGERFDPEQLTAAHRTLPLGSKVRVTNPRNGESVVVRINDRGPYAHGREIDVSRAAAVQLGLIQRGHGTVELSLVD